MKTSIKLVSTTFTFISLLFVGNNVQALDNFGNPNIKPVHVNVVHANGRLDINANGRACFSLDLPDRVRPPLIYLDQCAMVMNGTGQTMGDFPIGRFGITAQYIDQRGWMENAHFVDWGTRDFYTWSIASQGGAVPPGLWGAFGP